MWVNIRTVLIVLLFPVALTALSVWLCPILWVQGSSAAFNFGGALCVITIGLWWLAIWALKGWYKEKNK